MTPRERVHAALRKDPVDRTPVFMWFHPETTARLARLLDIPPGAVDAAFGNDVRQTWVNNNYAMEGIVHEHDGEGHTDAWGIRWVKQGAFNQIAAYPLAGAPPEAMRDYRFPVDRLAELCTPMASLPADPDCFVGADVSPCVFEMFWRLRGLEDGMLDLALNPADAAVLLEHGADFAVLLAETVAAQYRLDWLWTGDDVGGQQGMMMSPAQWRELVKPHLARVVAVGRDRGLRVAFHSCGAIKPIIPDLIEIGVNVLNPIQCNCPGMDPLALKREFGAALAFMGGVDTQGLLVNGSAAEVRAYTENLLAAMTADGGGYILAASHTVAPETPIDNIFAMYAANGTPREEIQDRAADIRAGV